MAAAAAVGEPGSRRVGFVGAGRMAEAIAQGLIRAVTCIAPVMLLLDSAGTAWDLQPSLWPWPRRLTSLSLQLFFLFVCQLHWQWPDHPLWRNWFPARDDSAVLTLFYGKVEAHHVLASAPTDRNLCHFQALGCQTTHCNQEVLQSCPLVFFATKPHVLPAVLAEVAHVVTSEHIVVSVAAGVSLSTLEELLPPATRVLRLSPNLPCVVQEGAMVLARGRHARNSEVELVQTLLEACGQCEEVPEAQVDIHTGLSGSGVAFVCLFSEALAEGAIKMGMPSGLAHRIATQTLLGTAKMLLQQGQHPAQLRTDVCTPGGTTIYGLHALEQGGLRAATMSAVEAATCRAKELSRK